MALSGFTDSLFAIIQEKMSLMQDSIEEKAEEANSGERDIFECRQHRNDNEGQDILM